jgi:hypothetical protein
MILEWIQNWFKSQCNGDWEHNHVIKIETIDNPGWLIEIDFADTNLKLNDIIWKVYEFESNNWVGFKIENNKYIASGDYLKLELILSLFKILVEKNIIADEFIMNKLKKGNDTD